MEPEFVNKLPSIASIGDTLVIQMFSNLDVTGAKLKKTFPA